MARLLLLLIFAAGLYFIARWIVRQPGRVRWQMLAITLAAVLLALVLTGRAHWLTALFAAVLPFLRGLFSLALGNWRLIRRLLGGMGASTQGRSASGGQTSTVQSKYILMTLDHDSGDIKGEILAGQFAGKMLDQLDLDDLLLLGPSKAAWAASAAFAGEACRFRLRNVAMVGTGVLLMLCFRKGAF